MRILFAGGGTGGHLMPGILLARKLQAEGDTVRFVVSGRSVERHFFQSDPFDRVHLDLEKEGGGTPGRMSQILRLPRGVWKANKEIDRFRPDLVLGIGGWISVPVGIAARLRTVPLDLLEINSIPGKATVALKPLTRRIYSSFQETLRRVGKKGVLTGPIVRPEIGKISRAQAREKFGFSPNATVLLVMGGSQGAGAINQLLLDSLEQLKTAKIEILHLCGEKDFELCQIAIQKSGIHAQVLPFCQEMEEAYACADLAISRGGAATVAELAAAKLPSLIIPYPLHADQHQWWNARELGEGALVIEEAKLRNQGLASVLFPIFQDSSRLLEMSQRLERIVQPEGIEKIVSLLHGERSRIPQSWNLASSQKN